MIRLTGTDLGEQIAAGIVQFAKQVNAKETKKGLASALYQGAKLIAKTARQLAPKAARKGKGAGKTHGATGALRRSYTAKKGVSRNGAGNPYAIAGPSATLEVNVRRGKRMIGVKPSNYAHLVEYGFNAHHRVPSVSGRNHERIVKKGVLWKGSDLERYMQKNQLHVQALTKGKAIRAKAFLAGSGQGSTHVAGQHIMERAYQANKGSVQSAIISSIGAEIEKAVLRAYMKQVRKYNAHASGNRGVR